MLLERLVGLEPRWTWDGWYEEPADPRFGLAGLFAMSTTFTDAPPPVDAPPAPPTEREPPRTEILSEMESWLVIA